jgi:hypothetical protein
MRSRRLPKEVIDRIKLPLTGQRDKISLLTQNSAHIHPWSYQDANEITGAITTLENAAETVTAFLHHATSQKYPLVKSTTDPYWKQQDCWTLLGPNDERGNILAEMDCYHEILRQANA